VVLDVHEYGITGRTWEEAGLRKDFGQQIGGLSNANMPIELRSYAWSRVIPGMREALAPRNVFLQRYLVTDGPTERFRYSTAALPYLDSFTTWGSVLTTWMVARKILENWLYWLLIDSVSIYLYLDRALYLTALLFLAYVVIALLGYYQWRKHYLARSG